MGKFNHDNVLQFSIGNFGDMNGPNPLFELDVLGETLRKGRWRLPVVLEGSRDSCRLLARQWAKSTPGEMLWVSDAAPDGAWTLPRGKPNHELGREADGVIFDLYAGLSVDTLAAVTGLVRAGGVLLILAPALSQWGQFDDPEYTRITVEPYGVAGVKHRFLSRLARLLEQDSRVARLNEQGVSRIPRLQQVHEADSTPDELGCIHADQRLVVDAVLRVAGGHRHRPLVVQADRGRGKSAALGIAAGQLLLQGKSVLVTAPRPESAATLMQFAHRQVGLHPDGALDFIAPDLLVQTLPPADLLLVDEAAALSPAILETLLGHYARIVFASTVQGYEGTGQGFARRFFRQLDQKTPGWSQLTLTNPVRWGQGDPLEACINDLLLLNACDPPAVALPVKVDQLQWLELTGGLAEEETLLRNVHGLLVSAHYRTRPSDLRALLDGPNIRLFALQRGNEVVAVVMVAEEGCLPAQLSDAILSGRRRPHGHVLAQSLAVHLNVAPVLMRPVWRVVRIAVHDDCRRQGLGQRCLQELERHARQESISLMGSVFAASNDVLMFWLRCGYTPVRLGVSRESTSGDYPVMVVRPLTEEGEVFCQQARERFEQTFPLGLADSPASWPVELIVSVWGQPQFPLEWLSNSGDSVDLQHFIAGHKTYENAAAAVTRYLHWWLSRHGLHDLPDPLARAVLVSKVLRKQSWPALVSQLKLQGHKQGRTLLRQAVLWLVQQEPMPK